jgi:sulfur-carrier protein
MERRVQMAVLVRIPTPLRSLTKGQAEVQVDAANVGDLIHDLEKQYPGMKERLVDESGEVRRFINFYINEEDVRFLQGSKTELKAGDQVSIVPAIAGGR